ncbi:trypsin alpha-3-like [Drosophila busckii]|uniref:trypsin alpha-3-like n=1 Tax=Drosophila busckii TaxID=30019 RepID=UPI00083ECD04|nr:trypsin alpha-3-like [Drosophila busckii]
MVALYFALLTISLCQADEPHRIVGGVDTAIKLHPWQVSLQRFGVHFCAGCIYSTSLIITAAHCLIPKYVSPNIMRIRAGSSYRSEGGVLLHMLTFKRHERFDDTSKINDIGVVRLREHLVFSLTIQPASLALLTPMTGAKANVTGWGKTKFMGMNSERLQRIETFIVRRATCASNKYEYGNKIKPSMICAYAKDKDACQGDSGGPMIIHGVLVGIVSWGQGCAKPRYPGVYANVAALRIWIYKADSETKFKQKKSS